MSGRFGQIPKLDCFLFEGFPNSAICRARCFKFSPKILDIFETEKYKNDTKNLKNAKIIKNAINVKNAIKVGVWAPLWSTCYFNHLAHSRIIMYVGKWIDVFWQSLGFIRTQGQTNPEFYCF